MNKRTILVISGFILFTLAALLMTQNITNAQFTVKDESFYLFGTIENDKKMTGFFSKNRSDVKDKNWFVFIANNGKVFKMSVLNKTVSSLFVDGKKVAENEISNYATDYKPFLDKVLRDDEIEKECDELEAKEKPLDRKIDAIDDEVDELEEELEELEEKMEKGSTSFTDNRKNIKEKIKQLNQDQRELEKQMDELEKLQDKLDEEQDALNLYGEMERVLQQISEDLKSLGVVKSTNNLSFKLSNIELIVNGKKASPEIYELLKNRYVFETKGESGFLYRWKGDL